MNQKVIIESLAMDLKRVALGYHRGSVNMADRFKEEVLKRSKELEEQNPGDYLINLVNKTRQALNKEGKQVAEDALMYSTLFQNFALKKM